MGELFPALKAQTCSGSLFCMGGEGALPAPKALGRGGASGFIAEKPLLQVGLPFHSPESPSLFSQMLGALALWFHSPFLRLWGGTRVLGLQSRVGRTGLVSPFPAGRAA